MEPKLRDRARRILSQLKKDQPAASVELTHSTPFELLVATILSAQCTDKRVNSVTPRLMARYPQALDFARADPGELESMIRPTGFYRRKAQCLIQCGRCLVDRFQGQVPQTMEALTALPGIGRKTANVILGTSFGKPAVVVDTHVKRVSNRLKFTTNSDPTKIEYDLQGVFPRSEWIRGSHRLLLHGRYVCLARKPKCERCVIYDDCPWEGKRPAKC